MNVLIFQAYSRSNQGDGLLVDLSVQMVKAALGETSNVTIIANDATSFSEYPDVIQSTAASDALARRLAGAVRNVLALIGKVFFNRKMKCYEIESRRFDVAVAVGGGYMRGRTFTEGFKCTLNNLYQLNSILDTGIPVVCLPQSIGPFPSAFLRRHVKSLLARCEAVFTRDDKSTREFGGARCPDLAALQCEFTRPRAVTGKKVLLVLRSIQGSRDVNAKFVSTVIGALSASGLDYEVVLQSQGRGNDDESYCASHGISGPFRTLKDALSDPNICAVVSTRLHGAIGSLLSGIPAIHLSYERKGFGAYCDLGLGDYVLSAKTLVAQELVTALLEVAENSANYWDKVASKQDALARSRVEVVAALKSAGVRG